MWDLSWLPKGLLVMISACCRAPTSVLVRSERLPLSLTSPASPCSDLRAFLYMVDHAACHIAAVITRQVSDLATMLSYPRLQCIAMF